MTVRPFPDIRALRKKYGWSQEQLAAHLGISQPALSRWEVDGPPNWWPTSERLNSLLSQQPPYPHWED